MFYISIVIFILQNLSEYRFLEWPNKKKKVYFMYPPKKNLKSLDWTIFCLRLDHFLLPKKVRRVTRFAWTSRHRPSQWLQLQSRLRGKCGGHDAWLRFLVGWAKNVFFRLKIPQNTSKCSDISKFTRINEVRNRTILQKCFET